MSKLPVVKICDVSHCFKKAKTPALQNISAEFYGGELIGLIGADGAGKTTLLRLLSGLLLPSMGEIFIMGQNTKHNDSAFYENLSYMPQQFGLYEDLTVLENLNLYADLRNLPYEVRAEQFKKLFKLTGLSAFTNRRAGQLSGGMKQKLGLACALVKPPKLLLLDEPSVGVDPIARDELWLLVAQLVQDNICVIWSTSYLNEAEKCQRVMILQEGQLLYSGDSQSMPENIYGPLQTNTSKFTDIFQNISVKPNETVIEVTNLRKQFGDFVAVDNINFKVQAGQIFGFLGPNGAGKSTTFKMICGLLKPSSGQAKILGQDFSKAPHLLRAQMGYMAQKFSLYAHLSVMQNLQFFAGIYTVPKEKQKIMLSTLIEIFKLEEYLKINTLELPLGIKQRLALACALIHEPKILFLDEPTSGVDPLARAEFWQDIQTLAKKNVTIMVTTHYMEEAEYCNKIALIYDGKIIAQENPEKFKQDLALRLNRSVTMEDVFKMQIRDYQEQQTHV